MEPALVIVAVAIGIVAVVVSVLVGRARARASARQVEQQRAAASELDDLQQRAGSALVRMDERVRLADDDLGFATAEFGAQTTGRLAAAVQTARTRLGEAFHLNQLLSDHVEDTPDQRHEWTTRILSLCAAAETELTTEQNAVAARRAAARRTPSELQRVRADAARIRLLLPDARATVAELSARYTADALAPVAANPDQAERLLEFTERSATVAEARIASSRDEEADAAARAAAETAQRAEALLDDVAGFEVTALRAEATLAAMVAESLAELGEARSLPAEQRRGAIDTAVDELQRQLTALPQAGGPIDPVGSLSRIRSANTALDDAVAEHSDRAARTERLRAQLVTAREDAEQQIAAARAVILDYRSPAGPDARTRLSEAERELAESADESDPERGIGRARRAASLAAEAASLARSDGGGYGGGPGQPWSSGGGYGAGGLGGVLGGALGGAGRGRGRGGRGGYGGGAGDVLGGVIGGLAIGGLLDGLGDLGDLFDD